MSLEDHFPFWEAIGFHDRLIAWIQTEEPQFALIATVVSWIDRQTREDPYRGVRRQTDLAANLWWGRIPGTISYGTAVFCSYWVDEELRQIRCDSISTLTSS